MKHQPKNTNPSSSKMILKGIVLISVCGISIGAFAQKRTNSANWELANRFSSSNVALYVGSSSLSPNFIQKSDRFWYTWKDGSGTKWYYVDPKAKLKKPLFNHGKMAAQISMAEKRPYDSVNLPITGLEFAEKGDVIKFTVDRTRYEYDLKTELLTFKEKVTTPARDADAFKNFSPDKKSYVYGLDHNLYFVEIVDGKDSEPVQISNDGVQYMSFTGNSQFNSGEQTIGGTTEQQRERRVRVGVTWSEDSKRFFVQRFDSRKVKDLWLVNSLSNPRPTLLQYKYAMPGDENIALSQMFVFDRASKKLEQLKLDKWKDQSYYRMHWFNKGSDKLRMIRRDRTQRNADLIEVDMASKEVKSMIQEEVQNAFLEVFQMGQAMQYIKDDGDFLWWSERSGWGHLYRYDSKTGKLHEITSGEFRVDSLEELDKDKGVIYFNGVGREEGVNPYYNHLYRVNLDGSGLQLVSAGNGNHNTTMTPSNDFIVDISSRIDMAPKAVLRDNKGNVIIELEEMDLSRLKETGWQMPSAFKVKAADGVTDIYGNMWKPFDFNPMRKYPIILNIYPGPQTEGVNENFAATSSTQQLAQLGFIVIQIGNRGGNPARSNAYHSYGYFNLRDYGLADKKAGVEQLAAKYPWIDINRVGIYGHSGGGFMTAAALLLPPYNDFFKVGVSSSGNHDNNVYNWNWSEQHHGLREIEVKSNATGTTTKPPLDVNFDIEPNELFWQLFFDPQATETKFEIRVPTTQELAANLKGKLLITHGDMDNNVHPAGSVRLLNELIKANKRFDYFIFPGQPHGYTTMTGYFNQMSWEYFAEHLLGDYYRDSAEQQIKGKGN